MRNDRRTVAGLPGATVLGRRIESTRLIGTVEFKHDHPLGLPVAFQDFHGPPAHAHARAMAWMASEDNCL